MGFGSKGSQSFATNYQAKYVVKAACGTTGNATCTTSVLTASSTSQTMILTSINLVSNANNIYGITSTFPFFYIFSFTGSNGIWRTTITFTNTDTSETFDFNYNSDESLTTNTAIPTLYSSNITTYNDNTYYTINQGTYSLTVNFVDTPVIANVTFGPVSFTNDGVPTQTITIN